MFIAVRYKFSSLVFMDFENFISFHGGYRCNISLEYYTCEIIIKIIKRFILLYEYL